MGDFVNLYEWIQTVKPDDFPPAPFKFTPWLTILDWDKFLAGLRRSGRDSSRARTGALQEDLRRLYDLWNSGRTK